MADNLWNVLLSMDNSARLLYRRQFYGDKIPQHVILYDALCKVKTYNEKQVIAQLKDSIKPTQFAYIKHTLLHKLIEAKTQQLLQNDDEVHMLYEVMQIKALRQNGLFDLADWQSQKTYIKASKAENYPILQMVTSEILKLNLFNGELKSLNEIDSIIASIQPTLVTASSIITVQHIYLSALTIKQKNWLQTYHVPKVLIQIETELNKLEQSSCHNATFQYYYESTNAIVHFLNGRFDECFTHLAQVILLWQNGTLNIVKDGEYYLDSLNFYIDTCYLLGKSEKVLLALEHPVNKALTQQINIITYKIIQIRAHLRMAHKVANYNEVKHILNANKAQFIQWTKSSISTINFRFTMSIVISYFVLEDYSNALYFAQFTLHDFKANVPQEFLYVIYLFIIIVVFEMKDETLFSSYYRSSMAFFAKFNRTKQYEKKIMTTLHKVFYGKNKAIEKKQLALLKEYLVQNSEDPYLKLLTNTFNYPLWIQSKIDNVLYRKLVQQNVEKQKMK
jgi:hypothetical protein